MNSQQSSGPTLSPQAQPAVATPECPRKAEKRQRRHAYSGVVLWVLGLFALAGVLWALLRPTYSAVATGDDRLRLGDEVNVEFRGFLWFAVLSCVVAFLVALLAATRYERWLGTGLYLWLVAWVVVGEFFMIVLSDYLVNVLHGVSDTSSLQEGDVVHYAPSVPLGLFVLIFPPCISALVLWLGLITRNRAEDN